MNGGVYQQPNYYGPMAQNLANSLSNMLGFGPQQNWQGLLQALGQSGLLPQYQPATMSQPPAAYQGAGGMIAPEGGQLLGQGAMQGSWPGMGGAPQATMTPASGINLQALGQINPQFYPLALQLLGQQVMSPLEQAQTRALGQPLLTPEEQREKALYGTRERLKQLPQGVVQAIQKGRDVIKRGANPWKVYNEIVADYPEYGLEIQRALVAEEKNTTIQALIEKLLR